MEDSSWHYSQTLKSCRTFLVREYTIRPQVDELVIHLHEQGHITYNERQDIHETNLTTDKMERLVGILIECKSDAKLQYESLKQKFEEDGRTDIIDKLDETLEIVKKSPKSDEDDIAEMVNQIKDDIANFKISDIHRCLTKVADYMATQTVGDFESRAHHSRASTQDAETEDDYTRLVQACKQGDAEMVEEITTKTPDCVNITNVKGETILMLSCQSANANVVKALLRCDVVDVNMRDNHGHTAFVRSMLRGRRGDIEVQSIMLECERLDPFVCDDDRLLYLLSIFELVSDNFPIFQIILKYLGDLEIEKWFELEALKYVVNVKDLQKAMELKIGKSVQSLLRYAYWESMTFYQYLENCITGHI